MILVGSPIPVRLYHLPWYHGQLIEDEHTRVPWPCTCVLIHWSALMQIQEGPKDVLHATQQFN